MEDRPGSAWFGLPAMLAVATFIAALKAVSGFGALIVAGLAIIVLFLAIGLAMTLANKR